MHNKQSITSFVPPNYVDTKHGGGGRITNPIVFSPAKFGFVYLDDFGISVDVKSANRVSVFDNDSGADLAQKLIHIHCGPAADGCLVRHLKVNVTDDSLIVELKNARVVLMEVHRPTCFTVRSTLHQ